MADGKQPFWQYLIPALVGAGAALAVDAFLGKEAPQVEPECYSDTDCPDGYECRDGKCVLIGIDPPQVLTQAAQNVAQNSATITGSVFNMGTAVNVLVSLLYGMTMACELGETTTINLTEAGQIEADLTGLDPDTTYYFRIKAIGDQTVLGDVLSFITLAEELFPPFAVTEPAEAVTQTEATLNGEVTNMGTAASVAVSFLYGKTTACELGELGPLMINEPAPVYITKIDLLPGTLYYFRIKAVGDGTVLGDILSFTTLAEVINPPAAPVLAAPNDGASISGELVDLSWGAVTGAVQYEIKVLREDGTTLHESIITGTGITVSSLPQDGTILTWSVRAYRDELWSNPAERTFISAQLIEIPAVPILVSPAGGAVKDATSIPFTWEAVPTAEQYQLVVQYDADSATFSNSTLATLSKTISGFPNDDTVFKWHVRASNSAGWGPWSEYNNFTNKPIVNVSIYGIRFDFKSYQETGWYNAAYIYPIIANNGNSTVTVTLAYRFEENACVLSIDDAATTRTWAYKQVTLQPGNNEFDFFIVAQSASSAVSICSYMRLLKGDNLNDYYDQCRRNSTVREDMLVRC